MRGLRAPGDTYHPMGQAPRLEPGYCLFVPNDTLSRSLHDLGLATWFGGTLANAVALNPAAGHADGASATGAVANAGWDRWTPVNGAAIAAHVAGSVGQLAGNASRVSAQRGVGGMVVLKT